MLRIDGDHQRHGATLRHRDVLPADQDIAVLSCDVVDHAQRPAARRTRQDEPTIAREAEAQLAPCRGRLARRTYGRGAGRLARRVPPAPRPRRSPRLARGGPCAQQFYGGVVPRIEQDARRRSRRTGYSSHRSIVDRRFRGAVPP